MLPVHPLTSGGPQLSEAKRKKDPLFAAAVLKLTFVRRQEEQSPHFATIYQGVLRDLGVSAEEVDAYLESNLAKVEEALTGPGRRGSS